MNFSSSLGILRIVAFLEGISYLSLAVTMYLKRAHNMPEPNLIVGMTHGVLFILYLILVVVVSRQKQWNINQLVGAGIASVLPFGTFVADARIFRKYA